jgi:hypothetical protein
MTKQRLDGQGGTPIDFEGLFEHVPEQPPDGPLEVDVSLTTGRTIGAVNFGLAIFAL